MGWGVKQNETFPQVFEQITGLKTLNGGISSYGTPREIMLLKKLNLEKTQYIFIQYDKNDLAENKKFLKDGFLKISSKEKEILFSWSCPGDRAGTSAKTITAIWVSPAEAERTLMGLLIEPGRQGAWCGSPGRSHIRLAITVA